MMGYQEAITASFNKALLKKLRNESKVASKSETKSQSANIEHTIKRRRAEDRALAKELGVSLKEITG
tara:strand:- start:462 stop:662 length:201 start_codon:yes stop_codon:yes gene_type:complete